MTTTRILGMIPARFGSRRFPGKMLADLGGKSLIQRTFENAALCTVLDELVVATDDPRIFAHVVAFGGKAVMTAESCPTGTERIAEAVSQNTAFDTFDLIINIQGDEPFLEPHVIQAVAEILKGDQGAVMSTAVVLLKDEQEAYDPSVVKCVLDTHGKALYFSRNLIPGGHDGTWNPAHTYYKHLGIYGYRRSFLTHYAALAPTPLQKAEDLEQLKVLEHG